jgi:hypothetical protein
MMPCRLYSDHNPTSCISRISTAICARFAASETSVKSRRKGAASASLVLLSCWAGAAGAACCCWLEGLEVGAACEVVLVVVDCALAPALLVKYWEDWEAEGEKRGAFIFEAWRLELEVEGIVRWGRGMWD